MSAPDKQPQLVSKRMGVALGVWAVAAVAGAGATAGLDHVIDHHHRAHRSVAAADTGSGSTPSDSTDPYGDITDHPPGLPGVPLPPVPSTGSLFHADVLGVALRKVEDDYGRKSNVAQFSIYPQALEITLVKEGGSAELVSTPADGEPEVVKNDVFEDALSTVYLSDVDASVPARLILLGVKQPELVGRTVERLVFVPDLNETDAGIEVEYADSPDTIVAELDGTDPQLHTSTGTRPLG